MRAFTRISAPGLLLAVAGMMGAHCLGAVGIAGPSPARAGDLSAELKQVPHKIVYETCRQGNWELFLVDADGSHPVNLTRTPEVDEMYPHASPDGTKVCFVADEGKGAEKVRSVYYAKVDGTGRTLVARNARQPCFSGDGTAIAYLGGEFEQFNYSIIANKGLFIYDLATGEHRPHPNHQIQHLFNVCWSPDGPWFVATVHGGMGYDHALIAIEAQGMKVLDLGIRGCRPEFSPDGKRIAWTPSDWALRIGDLDLTGPQPKVTNQRDIVTSAKPTKVYHIDWSPDGKYVAFSRGPFEKRLGRAPENVGTPAEGWNICVADATATNRWVAITSDGNSNKEPDWVFVEKKP
jgi:Tol biopolymer transport system component